MSGLADTPTWRLEISQAPRASLTIRMDVERHGAIPLVELAAIAKTVQETVDQIARSLHGRSGSGRTPTYLKELSALEAVGIDRGSVVLEIEAPHDMEQFPIEFGEADAGVQAVGLFVESLDALAHRDDPPEEIGVPARRSLRRFLRAVEGHDSVIVESCFDGTRTTARLVPGLIAEAETDVGERSEPSGFIEIVGQLYAADIENHVYPIRDELGRTRRLQIGVDLDDRMLARTLIGETVHVSAEVAERGDTEPDQLVARAIDRVAPPEASEYYGWSLESALKEVEPLASMDDLTIPDLTEEEADAFWKAINE